MRARMCAALLAVAGAAALPATASAADVPPAVAQAQTAAQSTSRDAAVASGSTKYFDFALAGYDIGGLDPLAAEGAFAFSSRTIDFQFAGEIHCLSASGTTVTVGGTLESVTGADAGRIPAAQVGQDAEVTLDEGSGDVGPRSSAVFFLGGARSTCGFNHALRDAISPGFVTVLDR